MQIVEVVLGHGFFFFNFFALLVQKNGAKLGQFSMI